MLANIDEVRDGFDPLDPKSNLTHRRKVNKILKIIFLIIGSILVAVDVSFLSFIGFRLYLRKWASSLGFSSVKEMINVMKLGFKDKSEWEEISSLGFKTKSE